MDQREKRLFLINELLNENATVQETKKPSDEVEQKKLLRALFNIRPPWPASDEFLRIQDEYLKQETKQKGIVEVSSLDEIKSGIFLWQGDITTLACDAIVNAANSALLGCFHPNHGCIDNAIHTFAGIQLRLYCNEIMKKQGESEPTGIAKITPAFNLPCKKIIHTVGPIVREKLMQKDIEQLQSCYRSCLEIACQENMKSIAFPCISTGEFSFPNDIAATIAIQEVINFIHAANNNMKVIFNVFTDKDKQIYDDLLKVN